MWRYVCKPVSDTALLGIKEGTLHFFYPHSPQFLAQLKLMDYSLLVGIHDVERAEQEEVESEDNEAEEEGESDGGGIGTPPDSPSNTLDSTKPLSPGEFDPTIDVYAIKSNESEYPVPFKG